VFFGVLLYPFAANAPKKTTHATGQKPIPAIQFQ
jgi:hypothetical protein